MDWLNSNGTTPLDIDIAEWGYYDSIVPVLDIKNYLVDKYGITWAE